MKKYAIMPYWAEARLMSDLNFEIRTEAESLVKMTKEYFSSVIVQNASPEFQNLMKVTNRLENLLREHEAPNPQR